MSELYPGLVIWIATLKKVEQERRKNPSIPEPPKFLILAGWHHSSHLEKASRWMEIKAWANEHNLNHLMPIENSEDDNQ